MPIEGVIQPVEIKVDERIRLRKYDYNIGSRKCFKSVGFREYKKTDSGKRFVLEVYNYEWNNP